MIGFESMICFVGFVSMHGLWCLLLILPLLIVGVIYEHVTVGLILNLRVAELLQRAYALAAAKALYRHTGLSAKEIATEALRIAAEVDLYTSGQVTVLTLGEA